MRYEFEIVYSCFFLLLIHILVNISIIIDMKVDTPKNVASERNKVTGTYQHASFVFQRRLHDFVCFCFQCVSCWMFLFSLFKRMSSIVSCFHFVFIFGSIPSEKLLLLHLYTNKLKMLKHFICWNWNSSFGLLLLLLFLSDKSQSKE